MNEGNMGGNDASDPSGMIHEVMDHVHGGDHSMTHELIHGEMASNGIMTNEKLIDTVNDMLHDNNKNSAGHDPINHDGHDVMNHHNMNHGSQKEVHVHDHGAIGANDSNGFCMGPAGMVM